MKIVTEDYIYTQIRGMKFDDVEDELYSIFSFADVPIDFIHIYFLPEEDDIYAIEVCGEDEDDDMAFYIEVNDNDEVIDVRHYL